MDKLLTPQEAAVLLGVSPRTIKEWLRQGKLQGVKVGKLWRVSESALIQFAGL